MVKSTCQAAGSPYSPQDEGRRRPAENRRLYGRQQSNEAPPQAAAGPRAKTDDWKKTWRRIEEKYNRNSEYCRTDPDKTQLRNILATINGAYIAVGLL
jgi:hypothetical protein